MILEQKGNWELADFLLPTYTVGISGIDHELDASFILHFTHFYWPKAMDTLSINFWRFYDLSWPYSSPKFDRAFDYWM